MNRLDPRIASVTDRIIERSKPTRKRYLDLMAQQAEQGMDRPRLSCGNFAHGFAAAGEDKEAIRQLRGPNIAIVTAYNDMLSAHQPYGRYPEQLKIFAREVGATAQVAGGTPAMCDGVTQGQPGMDLSLFSRDVIALSTAVALSHGMFDGVAMLGICDKIVPGLLIGALRFGHLPALLIPAGPMPSGLANKEKQRVRQLFAEGEVGEEELLAAESASYHGAGTCTFYGTANSNQMMMELMGLHIPGAAFVNPSTPVRQALNRAGMHRVAALAAAKERPLSQVVDEKAIVNATVGLLATGGSTNHAIHIPAIARAAGIVIDWQDFDELSQAVPLIARVYPSGSGDVNDFHHAGGMAFATHTLLEGGLLHADTLTAGADEFGAYATAPELFPREGGGPDAAGPSGTGLPPSRENMQWRPITESTNPDMLRPANDPFLPDGGMRLVSGNLGRAIFKTSAVAPEHWTTEAPCRVFSDQNQVLTAFSAGELNRDVVVVVRFQGPRANGMPELHKLTPPLGVLQDRGFKVALVTDGRMSGASGKVPAAIHCCPEALCDGPLARLRDGDVIKLCGHDGVIEALGVDLDQREPAPPPPPPIGTGRELFAFMRATADDAERGGSAMLHAMDEVA
jgi:phosphogluconate dehydratase